MVFNVLYPDLDNTQDLYYFFKKQPFEGYEFKGENIVPKSKELSNCFGPMSRINFLVGANSSGKSRLLRALAFPYDVGSASVVPIECIKKTTVLLNNLDIHTYLNQITNSISSNGNKLLSTNELKNIEQYRAWHCSKNRQSDNTFYYGDLEFPPIKKLIQNRNSFDQEIQHKMHNLYKSVLTVETKKKDSPICYIPILRGLIHPISNSNNEPQIRINNKDVDYDLYKERFTRDYSINEQRLSGNTIFTGLGLYSDLQSKLLGTHKERDQVKKFEAFLSENFYDDKEVTITPNLKKNVVVISVGEEKDLEIYNVGDGIQSLILLLYPIFTATDPTQFYIEEPESNMHAGLQRKFIEALQHNDFKKHQFFITTHSNHLLDTTIDFSDISLFLLSKYGHQKFAVSPLMSCNENVLDELGVNNSSVFLTNATVWVEGVTDRKYIKAYLEHFQAQYIPDKKNHISEDTHYSFVEYAGSNLEHYTWEEDDDCKINASKICSKSIVVADSDVQNKGTRWERLNEEGIETLLTLGKEIENMIPAEILIDKFNGKSNEKFTYEDQFEENLSFSDICNELAITKITCLETGTPNNYYKNLIPEKVNEYLRENPNYKLPNELRGWIETIYNFIVKLNNFTA